MYELKYWFCNSIEMLLGVGSNSKEKFGKKDIQVEKGTEKEQHKKTDRRKVREQFTHNYMYYYLVTRPAVRCAEQDLLKLETYYQKNDQEVSFWLLEMVKRIYHVLIQ